MKRLILVLCLTLTFSALNAQNTYLFSLEECLNYAFKHNNNKKSVELNQEAKTETFKQSKYERLPSINVSLSETFSNSKNNPSVWNGKYNISANMPIYDGSISNTIEQNQIKMEQASEQIKQTDNKLTLQILQTFLNVIGNQELLKYQETVLKTSEEQLKQGKEKYKAGKIIESDYLLLEAQYATNETNIIDTKMSIDNNLFTLKSLLSMNATDELSIIAPDTSVITDMGMLPMQKYVLDQALLNSPDLKISKYDIDIAKTGVKLSKSGYLPSLNLSAGVGTSHINNYDDFSNQLSNQLSEQVSLNLNIPIYNKNQTKSRITQSKIYLQQMELQDKQTELDFLQSVNQEYQNVVSSYNKYKTTNIKQNAYLKSLDAYNMQFNVGSITAVDLLQQQNNYISALNEFIQSKYNFILKRKILDVYMGIPVKM